MAEFILNEQIQKMEKVFYKLKKSCVHQIIKKSESAECQICNEKFGWYCPDSKDHVCHYFSENRKVRLVTGELIDVPLKHEESYETYDCCIFCGDPEERK